MRSKTLCALAVTAGTLTAVPAASAAAPPANDAFETPATLGDTSVTGTVRDATRQAGEPEHGSHSVWYLHRASTSGRVVPCTSPSSFSGSPDRAVSMMMGVVTPARRSAAQTSNPSTFGSITSSRMRSHGC